jgi:hypothetical protein
VAVWLSGLHGYVINYMGCMAVCMVVYMCMLLVCFLLACLGTSGRIMHVQFFPAKGVDT